MMVMMIMVMVMMVVFQVPSNYAPNYPIGHPRRGERTSGYSTLPHQSAAHVAHLAHNGGGGGPLAPAPQVGMVHPMSHATGVPQGGSYGPPPPPPHMQEAPQYAAHQINMPRKSPVGVYEHRSAVGVGDECC